MDATSRRWRTRRRRGPGPEGEAFLAAAAWTAALLFAGCGAGAPADPAPRDTPAATPEPVSAPPPVEVDWTAGELRAGGHVEAELGRGESHAYRLRLDAGRFVRIRVEQHGVDVELVLRDPEGETLLSADRLTGPAGPELVLAVAERAGPYVLVIRAFPSSGPGRYRAQIEALRPASAGDRRAASTYRRFRRAESYARESRERAAAVWNEALVTWRELGEEALEAEVLARLALHHYDAEEWSSAAARYREALAVASRLGEPSWELMLRHDLAALLIHLFEYDEAAEHYRVAAELAGELGDRGLQASILYGLGTRYQAQGEVQSALGHYEAALEVLDEDDPHTRPMALHNLGTLHWLRFQDPVQAEDLFLEARDLYRPEEIPTHAAWKARTLRQLGLLAQERGRLDRAREHLEEALAVRTGFDRCGRATALASLAWLEERDGAPRVAETLMAEAFATLENGSCGRSRATVELLAGELAEARGEPGEALAAYQRSRDLALRYGDRGRLVDSLSAIALSERAAGRLAEALDTSRQVLAILEDVRPTVLREDLRTAFFTTAQDHFDLHIGLLVAQGAEAEAWAVAERARSQALRDLLAEAGAGLRRTADPAALERESALRRRLTVLETRRLKAVEGGHESLRTLQSEVDGLVEEVQRVRGEIRRASPAYAALADTRPVSLSGVQRDLLDADTLLLEYRLGDEASWLWAITRESLVLVRLPPRLEIERTAREAVRWMRSLQWPGRSPPAVCELARQVLEPVASLLGHRRLVLVLDGVLETVPFAALPDPAASASGACSEAPPLAQSHEIVHLPSAGALVAQRRLLADREPAPSWLAMVADPVYGPDDERLQRPAVVRRTSLATGPEGRYERLRHAGEEAAAVLARLPRHRTSLATGLGATKAAVTAGSLAGHRIVHFATHGALHSDEPLLSFLALSEWAADGSRADGTLYAHEIYDLDLPAELVVLSACETALGRQARGEGLVSGLPRAFLYAGAERVLVSLWPVPDRSTRDLMDRFYGALFGQGLPPGRALQEAQSSLWRDGRPPYQWAGFVLQGDWRPLAPFSP